MTGKDDAEAAEQFEEIIKAIADRWGFDWRTGNLVSAAVAASTEQARDDVRTLVAMAIASAANGSPALRKRFHYIFGSKKSE
jgi:hypothetical protein